jgi:hypothetical protein
MAPARNTESTKPTSSHSTFTRSKPHAHTITEKKTTFSDHKARMAASTQATTRPEHTLEHKKKRRDLVCAYDEYLGSILGWPSRILVLPSLVVGLFIGPPLSSPAVCAVSFDEP